MWSNRSCREKIDLWEVHLSDSFHKLDVKQQTALQAFVQTLLDALQDGNNVFEHLLLQQSRNLKDHISSESEQTRTCIADSKIEVLDVVRSEGTANRIVSSNEAAETRNHVSIQHDETRGQILTSQVAMSSAIAAGGEILLRATKAAHDETQARTADLVQANITEAKGSIHTIQQLTTDILEAETFRAQLKIESHVQTEHLRTRQFVGEVGNQSVADLAHMLAPVPYGSLEERSHFANYHGAQQARESPVSSDVDSKASFEMAPIIDRPGTNNRICPTGMSGATPTLGERASGGTSSRRPAPDEQIAPLAAKRDVQCISGGTQTVQEACQRSTQTITDTEMDHLWSKHYHCRETKSFQTTVEDTEFPEPASKGALEQASRQTCPAAAQGTIDEDFELAKLYLRYLAHPDSDRFTEEQLRSILAYLQACARHRNLYVPATGITDEQVRKLARNAGTRSIYFRRIQRQWKEDRDMRTDESNGSVADEGSLEAHARKKRTIRRQIDQSFSKSSSSKDRMEEATPIRSSQRTPNALTADSSEDEEDSEPSRNFSAISSSSLSSLRPTDRRRYSYIGQATRANRLGPNLEPKFAPGDQVRWHDHSQVRNGTVRRLGWAITAHLCVTM